MSTVRIPLRSRKYPGMSAVIDEADAPLVREHDWHVLRDHNTWYAYRYIRREDGRLSRQAMHRLIMSPPEDMVVDHIDHDGLNNRRKNLRVCTHQQNSQNMKVDRPNRGIHFSKPTEVYRVFVERVHCGNYKDLVTAQLVRDCVAKDMWGEYADLHYPHVTEYPMSAQEILSPRKSRSDMWITWVIDGDKAVDAGKLWITAPEAAEILGVSVGNLKHYIIPRHGLTVHRSTDHPNSPWWILTSSLGLYDSSRQKRGAVTPADVGPNHPYV